MGTGTYLDLAKESGDVVCRSVTGQVESKRRVEKLARMSPSRAILIPTLLAPWTELAPAAGFGLVRL